MRVVMLCLLLAGCATAAPKAGIPDDPYGPQFVDYTEDGCVDWRSGFVVLNFRNGELLRPQECEVRREGVVEFRGELIEV